MSKLSILINFECSGPKNCLDPCKPQFGPCYPRGQKHGTSKLSQLLTITTQKAQCQQIEQGTKSHGAPTVFGACLNAFRHLHPLPGLRLLRVWALETCALLQGLWTSPSTGWICTMSDETTSAETVSAQSAQRLEAQKIRKIMFSNRPSASQSWRQKELMYWVLWNTLTLARTTWFWRKRPWIFLTFPVSKSSLMWASPACRKKRRETRCKRCLLHKHQTEISRLPISQIAMKQVYAGIWGKLYICLLKGG